MDLRNCKRCKNLFQYVGKKLCDGCIREEEKDFARIKEYLDEHEGATLIQVSKDLKIGVDRLKRYLREGRIVTLNHKLLICESCGESISKGRFCEGCQKKMSAEIREVTGVDANNQGESKKVEEEKKRNAAFKFLQKD